jgi:hypothetical protein
LLHPELCFFQPPNFFPPELQELLEELELDHDLECPPLIFLKEWEDFQDPEDFQPPLLWEKLPPAVLTHPFLNLWILL